MIHTKLIDLVPEDLPDEAAHYLVNFIAELSLALENHYYAQLKRYRQEENLRAGNNI
jgi:hypothetical protein